MKAIINYIYTLSNLLMFLHISYDENFDTLHQNKHDRFSLFYIPLFTRKFYIFSLKLNSSSNKFKIFDILNLRKELKVTQKDLTNYKVKFSKKNDTELDIISDAIKEKNDACNDSRTILLQKVNSYLSIILVSGGFVFYLYNELLTLDHTAATIKAGLWFVFIHCAIYTINTIYFTHISLQIKAHAQHLFSSIVNLPTKYSITYFLYFNWQNNYFRTNYLATLTRNIELNIIRSLMFSFLLLAIIIPMKSYSVKETSASPITSGTSNSVNINIKPNLIIRDNKLTNITNVVDNKKPSSNIRKPKVNNSTSKKKGICSEALHTQLQQKNNNS